MTAADPGPGAELPAWLARLGSRHPLSIAAIVVAGVVTVVTAVATVAAFGAGHWWVLDVLTSFRPQFLAVLVPTTVALAILRRPGLVAVGLVALALNGWQVAPVFADHQPTPVAGASTLSIAHLNLQGHVRDGADIDSWLAGRPAQIVVLLDVGDYLLGQLERDSAGYRVAYSTGTTATATSIGRSGVLVLTTDESVSARRSTLEGLPTSAVEIAANIGGRPVRLLGLHTVSPTSAGRHDRRDGQLRAVATWLAADAEPAIAFGDFNTTWFSPEFRSLLRGAGARSSQLGYGIEATWPDAVAPAAIAIDQSVYTGRLTAVARVRGPSFASEHRTLVVTYALAAG